MQNIKILNKKEIKSILELIKNQWGASADMTYAFLKTDKGKIYVVNSDISRLELGKLRINSIGLYFAEIRDEGIRLSIEGSQIIGPKSKKSALELNDNEAKEWMRGNDLEMKGDFSGFLIIKHKEDFLGCGKYANGKILNYIGKARRVNSII